MLLPSALRAQTDMTSKIQNADLSSNEGWTITCTEGQVWATQKGTAPYNVSEAYAGWGSLTLTEYGISQKVVLPKGAYELSGYAFYRYGEAFSTDPTVSNAVLYAGEEEVPVVTLGSIEGLGSYANSVDDASSQFSQGNYLNTVAFNVLADDTEVEIGFKGTHDLMRSWFICGPVKLVQTSETPIVADLTELIEAYNEAKAAAQEVGGKMSAEARTALDAAIAAEVDMESEESLKTATKNLTSATNAAKTSISRFEGVVAYLAKMAGVLDLTNVYTPESFATYITDVKNAYDAGTMTDADAGSYTANTAYNTVWHSTNFIDDVLLSSWTIGGEPVSDYNGKLYINTWSVEGNSDGSNLLTPFFEYWTGDDQSLANNTLAAKVEGLAPGNYYVEVLARVRLKNGADAPAAGITMSVNGGEAVDLCAGTQSTHPDYPMMYYGTFTAEGVVGEDGVLNIEIKVEDTNCSWIAYRDVKYMTAEEKLESDLAKAYDAAMASIKDGNFYQIYTLVGETPYYLTNTGTLTANAEEAYSFKMTQASKTGTKYAKGWNTSVPFTNPTLSNGSTGDIVNDGSIHRNNNNRDDFERQVFFEQDGKYAVRATNGGGTNWGANTYWAQVGTTELPEAGYHLAPQYIWMLNDVTGVALLAETKAIVEAKDNVGSGLFMKPEDAFATFEEAVDDAAHVIEDVTATSEEKDAAIAKLQEALAAYNSAPLNSPDPAQAYTFQQKASELFMGLSASGVSLALEENASELFFEAGENGGYFIHDAEGQYVGFEGSNNWTMSTSAEKKYEWKVTLVGDNYYTLSKPSNSAHHVGTNDNDKAEGAPCYADKNNSDNSYYLWKIEEAPEKVEDMTALIKNNAYLENGYEYWEHSENAFKPRTYEAPMNLITYSGNAEFEVYQTIENVPAGLYKLTVNAFYRAGSLEDEMAAIAAGTELEKHLAFYAEVGNDVYSKKVMNISEGASATSHNEGDAQLADGKYVPNSAAGARDWYIAGEYTNELLFNVFEDGTTVIVGLDKAVGLPSDYCPVGAWHLYRLGDPDESQATPDNNSDVSYEMVALTRDDYHNWTASDATGEITATAPYCLYEIGTPTGNIYGDSNVAANNYADLTDCYYLVVNATSGAPRFLFNRPTDDSQDYINIPNNAEQTAKYMTSEAEEDGSTTYYIDVKAIVADYGFCHLNAIKGANWNDVNVAQLYVLRLASNEPDVYTGIVEQTQSHPVAGVMGTTVSDQTVTIETAEDGLTANITFSGFDLPMAALGSFPEFTIEGVNVETAEDGKIYYSLDQFQVLVQNGQMTMPYNGTLEGEQADADATPVIRLTLQNATLDEVYFGADQAAIDAYKEAHEEEEYLYTVGAEDLSDGYKGDVGPALTVQNGQTAHFYFKNLSKAEANYQNWLLLVNENGEEKVALRADNWENVSWGNEGCVSDYNWDTFLSDMNGSMIAMDVTYLDGTVTMKADIITADGTVYNYTYTKGGFTAEAVEVALSEEAAHLVVYKAEVDGESIPVGINGIVDGLNDDKAHKILRDGKIVIVKGDKVFNVNGAAVK